MTWYVASLLFAIRKKSGSQDVVPLFENAQLIQAETRQQAHLEAERSGRLEAEAEDQLTLNDDPAEMIFLGVRQLRSVYNPYPLDQDKDRPTHGTELTHSYFEVNSLDEAKLLARGKRVNVTYVDDAD
jgi:hypothetical protein